MARYRIAFRLPWERGLRVAGEGFRCPRRVAILILTALTVVACEGEHTADLELHIDLGEASERVPPDTLPLVRGPQGLQHIELRLRVDDAFGPLAVDRATVTLQLHDAEGARLSDDHRAGYALERGGGTLRVDGVRFVLRDPGAVIGRRAVLEATLDPVGGVLTARGTAHGVVRWSTDAGVQP